MFRKLFYHFILYQKEDEIVVGSNSINEADFELEDDGDEYVLSTNQFITELHDSCIDDVDQKASRLLKKVTDLNYDLYSWDSFITDVDVNYTNAAALLHMSPPLLPIQLIYVEWHIGDIIESSCIVSAKEMDHP